MIFRVVKSLLFNIESENIVDLTNAFSPSFHKIECEVGSIWSSNTHKKIIWSRIFSDILQKVIGIMITENILFIAQILPLSIFTFVLSC